MAAKYKTSSGGLLSIGQKLGGGGEGLVFESLADPSIAIKIYHSNIAAKRRDKIIAMTGSSFREEQFVAFPREIVLDESGKFAGFTMRKAIARKPIHQLYSPTGRKTEFSKGSFPFLLRTAINIAKIIARIHQAGYLIGDINHSGILISQDAQATFIDCDSFQVFANGTLYRCEVGVSEFTPPELQFKNLEQANRTANHDAFGLALLIFHLLFMGRHPFSGRSLSNDFKPIEQAIAEYRFAYSVNSNQTQMRPPPFVPTLKDVPHSIAEAFEKAFSPLGATTGRPTAAEWADLLTACESQIVVCTNSPSHHYFRAAHSCPWCRMERGFPGFMAFAPLGQAFPTGAPLTIASMISKLNSIPDVSSAPDLDSIITINPSSPVRESIYPNGHLLISLAGSAFGAALFQNGVGGFVLGCIAIAVSVRLGATETNQSRESQEELKAAHAAWDKAKKDWSLSSTYPSFNKERQSARQLIDAWNRIPNEEKDGLDQLQTKRRQAQLRKYLEQFHISTMKVAGVGNGRKAQLKAFGIETAADVDFKRIENIKGLGKAIASAIVAWKYAHEHNFSFNPNEPLDPNLVNALKASLAQKRQRIEAQLSTQVAHCESIASRIITFRQNAPLQFEPTLRRFEDAKISNARYQNNANRWQSSVICAVIGVALLFGGKAIFGAPPSKVVASTTNSSSTIANRLPAELPGRSPASQTTRPADHKGPPTETSSSPILPKATNTPAPSENITASAPPTPVEFKVVRPFYDLLEIEQAKRVQQRLSELGYLSGIPDGVWGNKSRVALWTFRRQSSLGFSDEWNPTAQELLFSSNAPRFNANIPATSLRTEYQYPPANGASRNPLNRLDALWIQTRLRDIRLYTTDPDGTWGAASRIALKAFKSTNGLPADDIFDGFTETKLSSAMPAVTEPPFLGGWWESIAECRAAGSGEAPVRITSKYASANGGVCLFNQLRPDGTSWKASSTCRADGREWDANITLSMTGSRLSWNSEKGSTTYYRCN